jgi:hypothetical protein
MRGRPKPSILRPGRHSLAKDLGILTSFRILLRQDHLGGVLRVLKAERTSLALCDGPRSDTGGVAAILSHAGLYSSGLTDRRRQREAGAFEALCGRQRLQPANAPLPPAPQTCNGPFVYLAIGCL